MPNLKKILSEALAEQVDGLKAMNQTLRYYDPFRLGSPAVDGFVVNPNHMPLYLLGQIAVDGNPMQPFENVWNNMQYLKTSTGDSMYCNRLQEITGQFIKANVLAETG